MESAQRRMTIHYHKFIVAVENLFAEFFQDLTKRTHKEGGRKKQRQQNSPSLTSINRLQSERGSYRAFVFEEGMTA